MEAQPDTIVRKSGTRSASISIHVFFAAMVAGVSLLAFSRERQLNIDGFVPRIVTSAVFIWHLLMVPLAFAGILAAALWLLAKMAVGSRRPNTASGDGVPRREFFVRLCALTPPALTVALSLVSEYQLRHFRDFLKQCSVGIF